MKQPGKRTSPAEENKKVQPNKQFKDNKVREDKNNSIYKEANDKQSYPYDQPQEKQFNNQPEFIDRNNDSKDKG